MQLYTYFYFQMCNYISSMQE